MKVVQRHVLEITHGTDSTIPFEFDELDDGRFLMHHRTGKRIISAEDFQKAETTQQLPRTARF